MPRIKLDITHDELLVEPASLNLVNHPYSDIPIEGIKTLCYSYIEIFSEKIRALAERERARSASWGSGLTSACVNPVALSLPL